MADCIGNTGLLIDDDPRWNNSIFNKGNLPPNTIIIDDMDLGCGTIPTTEDPTPSLEGYWDRDSETGTLHPKVLADMVMVGKTAQSYDEAFGVVGKIYTTGGYMLGTGNILLFPTAAAQMAININYRNSVYVESYLMRGGQANAWYLNTLGATNSPDTPPYTFYGDLNTGMYRHEDEGIAFTGGGVNKLVLNANGTIQLVSTPATAADASVPVLARNATTGLIEQRVLSELHTHSNIAVLDLLTAPGGLLAYNGTLVFNASNYYTQTEVDTLDAALLANINTRSLTTHNHNLADLTEHSYNSLVDTPDLSDLHAHSNKPTLDRIPDYTGATQDDVMVRDGAGISWIAPSDIMVYPDAGIALSTGLGWGTSITNNSANWNTAFGWGDHSGLYANISHASTHLSTGGDTISLFSTDSVVSGLVIGSNSVGATYYLNANGAWSVPAGAVYNSGSGITIDGSNNIDLGGALDASVVITDLGGGNFDFALGTATDHFRDFSLNAEGISFTSQTNAPIVLNAGTNNIQARSNINMYNTGSAIVTGQTDTYTFSLSAWDVDGTVYVPFITFTAGNTPTMTFPQSGGGTTNFLNAGGGWSVPGGSGSTTFIGLTDSPADWTGGVAGWLVMVDSTPDAVEFVDPSGYAINNFSGTLTGNWIITGSNSNQWKVQSVHAATGSVYAEFSDAGKSFNVVSWSSDAYSGGYGSLYVDDLTISLVLEPDGPTNPKGVYITAASMLVRDDISAVGFQYNADYSTNGTTLGDRWIPDKGYVDSVAGITPIDNILDWNGVAYAPYVAQTDGAFDSSTTNPIHSSNRLNFDGEFYAYNLYAGNAIDHVTITSGGQVLIYTGGANQLIFQPYVSDGAGAYAYMFDTENTLVTEGSTIATFKSNGVERLIVRGQGELQISARSLTGLLTPGIGYGLLYQDSADDKLYFKTSTATYDLTSTGGTTVSFGDTDEIPHMNAGTPGTDFDYSPKFTFDGNELKINQTVAGTNATLSIYHTDNINIGSNVILNMSVTGGATTNIISYNSAITGDLGGVPKGGGSFIYAGTDSTSLALVTAGGVPIVLSTNDTKRLEIGSTGSLLLWNSGDVSERLTIAMNTDNYASIYHWDTDPTGYKILRLGTNVTASALLIDGATGNVGIGVTPATYKLNVNGDMYADHHFIDSTPAAATASGITALVDVDDNGFGVGAALHMDTDGNYIECDADLSTKMPCSALALETGTGAAKKVLLMGYLNDASYSFTVGAVVYVSTVEGGLTTTAPSGLGDFVQAVGIAMTATSLFFNPDFAIVERTT